MIYIPFFDMKLLVHDGSVNQLAVVVGLLILFHVLFVAYSVYRLITAYKKSSLRMRAQGI